MDIQEAIRARRAIKQFDADYAMSEAEEARLFELVRLSPTAFNIQNWRFVVLRDPALRARAREIAWDQSQVTDASLFVVLCADLAAWEKDPARYWSHAPEAVARQMVGAIDAYYRDRPDVQRDEAMRSCGIAAQTMMLAAQALGYDSCPMDGFDFQAMGELIGLPEDHVIGLAVAVGKGTREPWPRGGQLSAGEVIFRDGFAGP